MQIDLTKYVIAKWGPWLEQKDAWSPNELRLGSLQDGVTLAGPLRVRVAVQARNQFTQFGSSRVALQSRDVYCYTLDIAPGQLWTYPAAQLNVATLSSGRDASGAVIEGGAPAGDAALSGRGFEVAAVALGREALWGANAGFGISIRPAGPDVCADPCATDPRAADPCDARPSRKNECRCGGGCASGCGCRSEGTADDLPCDYATGSGSQLDRFFPAACEPCTPGAFVGTPPVKRPALLVPPARGGTVRTRYFNGMFITKEDLWTDQNNNRIKHALMNRAMGQGVVWGLDVAFDGNAVCVLPGYAVDCCGNDIVISSPYRVDAEALVRDPAAAASSLSTRSARRMNLLLEYFECPEQPRPVHGDPCAPDSVSCEMSRIRETGRLRLVPPCDVDDSGPIKDFLDEVRRLKGDPVVGTILSDPGPAAPSLAVKVPFSVLIEGLDDQGVVGSNTFRPKLTTDSSPIVTGDVKGLPSRSLMNGVRVTVTADRDGDFQIVAGEVVKQAPPGSLPTPTRTSTTIVWNDTLPGPERVTFTYLLNGWQLKNSTGGVLTSPGTAINLTIVVGTEDLRMKLAVDIQPSQVVATSPSPATFPCLAEACDPDGRPRFPVAIPWLHPDPQTPNAAADPKVIVLAILYALSVSRIVQRGPGATDDVRREQEAIAAALNVSAWRLLYGNAAANEQADLVEALRKLFAAWCKALLYPGPRCECGCDPHGVVIGCAQVDGGTIRTIDAWGGRRWVVHYPLLAYWGKQFGVQPLDALASRFFDLICCVAHVYPARDATGLATGLSTRGSIGAQSAVVPFGASVLIFDEPANVARRLAELGLAPARTETVGPTEFIALAVEALHTSGATAPPGATLVHYTVTGLSNMHFVTPAATGIISFPTRGRTGSAVADPGRPPTTRAADMVRTTIAARPQRTAIPELLRDVTATLTHDLLGVIAPEPTTDAAKSVRDDLAATGITSIAGLLDTHPEDLHVDILSREKLTGLAELLNVTEKRVAVVTKAVGDTMVKFAADRRIASREDLGRPQIAATFAKALGTALKGAVPAATLTAIVDRVARGGPTNGD